MNHLSLIFKFISILLLQLAVISAQGGGISASTKLMTKKTIGKVAPPLMPVISYLLDPDSNLIQESIEDAMLFSGLTPPDAGACSTLKCQEFADRCKVSLHLPEQTSVSKVLANKKSKECVDDFLTLPLDVQADLRTDNTVDEIISIYTPAIRDLKCSAQSTEVEINQNGKILTFQLDFKKQQSRMNLEKISGIQTNGEKDRIFYNDQAKAQQLQHCQSLKDCKYFTADDVRNRSLYAWRNDRLKTSSSALNQQLLKREAIDTPVESFRWARSAMALADHQANRIYECCHPTNSGNQTSNCEKFFNQRLENYNKAAQRVKSKSAQ